MDKFDKQELLRVISMLKKGLSMEDEIIDCMEKDHKAEYLIVTPLFEATITIKPANENK